MLRLKADSSKLSQNGSVPNDLFSDISTRSLNSVIIGENCGKISIGSANAFVGFECGNQNMDGSFGVFIGYKAGQLNKNGNWNTFVGSFTGRQNTRGDKNTFVGFRAGELNLDGSECVAIGANAMRENFVGNRNVAVGISAGERILEGDNNTMIGAESGQNIRSGNLNTMAGYRSGKGAFKGNENTYFGAYAGYSNELGDGNAFIGYKSGEYLTTGNYNVGVGAYTLQYASEGSCNIAIGAFSGATISGTGNVLVGTGASGNTKNGNNNTTVGTNAGNNANGDNNVYIGYEASKNTVGDKNVVIGSSAFSTNNASNSVIIGYNTADNIFTTGSNNIFIGVGADTTTSKTSFAIAIGSENTRSGNKAISIGENIQNGGYNSLLLGYDMYSDSDQCVSIGYQTQINNVIVFNDPLNYIFPVNRTTEYSTFNFTENYTDTLFINGESNTVAIASINKRNIFDSGCNLLQGVTRTSAINLLDYFNSNVIYHNVTILHTNINTTLPFINSIIIPPHNFTINNSINNYILNIPVEADGSNLIPANITSIDYEYVIGRRLFIDTFDLQNEYVTMDNKLNGEIFITNLLLKPVVLQSFEIENYFNKTNNRPIITQHPIYGDIVRSDTIISYSPYPEALFAENDTFKVTMLTQFDNTYSVISENIPEINIKFDNKSYPVITNINFHQEKETVVDFTYSNVIEIDPNLEFINLSNLKIIDKDIPINNHLSFDDGKTFTCTYHPILQNAVSYSNMTFNIEPFTLNTVELKFDIEYIIEYPEYGTLSQNTYIPVAFNFTKDAFKVFSNDTVFTIDILTINIQLQTMNLNILQKPVSVVYNSNEYLPIHTIVEKRPILLNFRKFINGVVVEYDTIQQTTPIEPGGYYIHTCNIEIEEIVATSDYETYTNLHNGVIYDENNYYDYFAYRRDETIVNNPFIQFVEYNWDYSKNDGFGSTKIIYEPFTENQIYSNLNNVEENRFFVIEKRDVFHNILYKQASNIDIYTSNLFYQTYTYIDTYNTYIYTDRIELSKPTIITSNVTLIENQSFIETITHYGFSNEDFTTSNIATLLLQDTNFYKYNGIYDMSHLNETVILRKDVGHVNTFYQSNITNKEIHILGSAEKNLILTDIEVPITYYNNIVIGSVTEPIVPIDFRIGEYDFNNNILIYAENIAFLDNIACVREGNVFIEYIDVEEKLISQHIPSSYFILNPINLNIGLTKVAKVLNRTDLFFNYNSSNITYTLNIPENSVIFYKNNIATVTFTQEDINNGLITIEGLGSVGLVVIQLMVEPTNTTHELIINKYIQNDYLSPVDTSNIIKQSNTTYINEFKGLIWDDLDSRREDATIHILNNPSTGFLYSSNTNSVVNKILYSDFKKDNIHYIPYIPLELSPATFEIFLSYSNVASPLYSLIIKNEFNIQKPLENVQQRVFFLNERINIDVDESSYTYFNEILNDFEGKQVIFYIINPPTNGVILNKLFLSVAYFTSQDIIEKRVFYQNYKGTDIDEFIIKVATNPYDLSLNSATVILRILPFPKLLKNNYDYIYNDTISERYYPLDRSNLDVSFGGGIYVYETDYMDVFIKNNVGEYLPTNSFIQDTDDVYYRPSSSFFQFNSNENKTMKMKFFTYNNPNVTDPSPLTQIDIYKDIYIQEWFSKYNTFDSKNEIISELNPNQQISYIRNVPDILFKDKKCKIQFDYKPYQSVLDFSDEYNEFLRTYVYSFKIIDFSENVLIEIKFENSRIIVKIGVVDVEINVDVTFDWNRFYMINNDDTNNDKLSIYINDINYTKLLNIKSINLDNLKTIVIDVPITDPANNYTTTRTEQINVDGSRLYYNLENYNTSLYFKNFQILVGYTNLTRQSIQDETPYNIAIGDFIRINGYNNICIGKNFLTTGTGSIVIGNDIGSVPNTTSMLSLSFNEVFNSIIISTSSFIETKVRDVIAIGNNIFNNAGGSEDIDLFFSKNPVLIGNNITPETIDFHVNIQNSFLKTDVGYKQIYCGLSDEAVCVGYSNNVYCDNSLYKLYVNGNISVTGSVVEKSLEMYRVRYIYPSRNLNESVYMYDILWGNIITDIRESISFEYKFRFIGDSEYGYYNFQSVLLPFSRTELYSITHSMQGNITHTVTALEKGIRITLNWNSNFTDYLLANMEVDAVCLSILGNLVFA